MTSTVYLEQALTGSLLMYPERLPQADRLTDADFTDPTSHAIWNTLRRYPPTEADPLNVLDVADHIAHAHPDLHPALRSPATIADLQARAPYRPHIDAYAALIVDATIRREALTIARQLCSTPPDDPERYARQAADARARLATLADRLHNGPPPQAKPPPTRHCYARLARLTSPAPDPDLLRTELTALAAVIHDYPHGARERVLNTVGTVDLQTPDLLAAWKATETLGAAGIPIDEITTYWQLSHQQATVRLSLHLLRDIRHLGHNLDDAMKTLNQQTTTRTRNVLQAIIDGQDLDRRPTPQLLHQVTTATSTTLDAGHRHHARR